MHAPSAGYRAMCIACLVLGLLVVLLTPPPLLLNARSTRHDRIIGKFSILGAADDRKPTEASPAQRGRQLFLKLQCVRCHSGGAEAKGPNLGGVYGKVVPLDDGEVVKVNDEYLRESIVAPKAKVRQGWRPRMPPDYKDRLTEAELLHLVAYIKSLRPGDIPGRGEEPDKLPRP